MCVRSRTIAKEELNFPKAEIEVAIRSIANCPGPKILVNELVIDDGRSQHADGVLSGLIFWLSTCSLRVLRISATDHAALAQDVSVLLAGNFLRHFKHHLDEGICRQALRALK